MHLTVLGSGSGGNSALITCGSTSVLVDAGLSASQLQSRLEAVASHPSQLTAILITHEHGDHVRGLEVLTKKFPIPIYCSAMTRQVVRESFKAEGNQTWKVTAPGATFRLGELEIECFNVPHDAVDPMGFIFRTPQQALGIVSDLGHAPPSLVRRLHGLHTLFIEANYDSELLQADQKRPFSTKQRISSQHGHLSNLQTSELIASIAHAGLERIVLGHLSSDCNTERLAIEIVRQTLGKQGFPEVAVHCAAQATPSEKFPVRQNFPPPARSVAEAVAIPSPSPSALATPPTLIQAELF